MTRAALLIAAAVGIGFALHLVWRPAPRVDRDAWPEGVGW